MPPPLIGLEKPSTIPDIMEGPDYMRFVLALAFVLALMGILGHLAKRLGWGKLSMGTKNGQRLSLVETRHIDGRHKLALVKCDGREYLLVLGPDHSRVIDNNIAKDAA